MKKLIVILMFLTSMSLFMKGQSFIDKATTGSWSGSGTLMGAEATFKMDWKWVLDEKFINLQFQNSRKTNSGEEIVFKANAFYKPTGGANYSGTWFDSRGISFPLKCTLDGNAFTVMWGSEETEQGKTEYFLLSSGEIQVKDFILQNDTYAQFGEAVYKMDR